MTFVRWIDESENVGLFRTKNFKPADVAPSNIRLFPLPPRHLTYTKDTFFVFLNINAEEHYKEVIAWASDLVAKHGGKPKRLLLDPRQHNILWNDNNQALVEQSS